MRPPERSVAAALAVVATLGTAVVRAQDAVPRPEPRWEIAPYTGVARHSPVGRHFGVTPDRDHLFIGVHITGALWRRQRWALRYAPDIVPLLIISNNPKYRTITVFAGRRILVEDGHGPVAGFALSPIGLETDVSTGSRWRGYAAGALGGVWFTRNVPVARARVFNYTFEMGGGVQWQLTRRNRLRVGYKFHHLSNANSAETNPGIDAHVVLVGVSRAIGRR